MSLYLSPEAFEQLNEMERNPGLMLIGLHDLLKKINEHGFDKGSKDLKLVPNTEEEIYVLRYHDYRLFFAPTEDGVVLMNLTKKG